MIGKAICGLLLVSWATHTWAQGKPKPLDEDPHSIVMTYNPDQTFPVTMQYGLQCVVQISPQEQMLWTIINPNSPVESLDAKKVQGDEPLINYVPLVGAQPGGPASVTIFSKDMTGRQHTYPLLVTVLKPPSDGKVTDGVCLKLKFTYSAAQIAETAPATAPKPSWKEQQAIKLANVAKARLQQDPWYCGTKGDTCNDNYWVSGRDGDIAPIHVHDNGMVTLFDFQGNAPAIVSVETHGEPNVCKGLRPTHDELHATEQTVNQDKYLDKPIVRSISRHWRIRDGQKVDEIWNCGFRYIRDPGTGTGTDEVVRSVITQN